MGFKDEELFFEMGGFRLTVKTDGNIVTSSVLQDDTKCKKLAYFGEYKYCNKGNHSEKKKKKYSSQYVVFDGNDDKTAFVSQYDDKLHISYHTHFSKGFFRTIGTFLYFYEHKSF